MILRVLDPSDPPDPSVTSLFANVRTVFLDRDGVINQKAPEGQYVASWEAFHPLPGVRQAIAALNASARRIFVVTNQRGVALGLYGKEDVEALHGKLQDWLAEFDAHIDGFYYCPHDKACCHCRKPLPGLFEQAIREHPGVTPETSLVIGDSLSDVQAGKRLGMRAIFIEGDPERRKAGAEEATLLADRTVGSLLEATALLDTL